MRHLFRAVSNAALLTLALALVSGPMAGQTAVTGTCKDGTTTSAKTKSGACRGHGGVATWTGAATTTTRTTKVKSKSATTAVASTAPTATTASSPKSKSKSKSKTAPSVAAPAAAPAPAAPAQPLQPAASVPAPKSVAAAPSGAAPAGATAQCKDGTYSTAKHHSGACAHHGGVAQWLDGSRP